MNKTKKWLILLIILSIPLIFAALYRIFSIKKESALEKEIRETLSKTIILARQHIDSFDQIREKYGIALIPHLEEYTTDPCETVSWCAYSNMIHIGLDSNSLTDRQKIVYYILRNLYDDKMKIGDRQYSAERLQQFIAEDFSEESRDILKKLFSRDLEGKLGNLYDIGSDIFLLIGVADMKSELPVLKDYIEKNSEEFNNSIREKKFWYSQTVWKALKARARMGAKEDIQKCIKLVEDEPDEIIRVTRLLKDLSYVRQSEVVEYLNKYLNIDKVIPPQNIDTLPIDYALKAAEALENMIKDFPGPSRKFPFDVEFCRKWMAEQKEWKIIR